MSISKEGKLVSASLAELRRFGFIVTNFNTHRHVKTGSMQKLTDYIIAGHTGVHFIEVKLESTGDTMKPHQKLFKHIIERISERCVWVNYWLIVNLDQAHTAFQIILNGTEEQLGEKLQ